MAGRERGEILEVVRAADGSVDKLYFATYAVTRAPLAFAELAELADAAKKGAGRQHS